MANHCGGAPGSSPLTRGKRLRATAGNATCGLIPAHAGKTWDNRDEAPASVAHPRSRGENLTGAEDQLVSLGSSPLTRGKPASGPAFGRGPGLIPAHAGKTVGWSHRQGISRAHPRSRGENDLTEPIIWEMPGSSPLTRGKHEKPNEGACNAGLIPAHAGKTCARHATVS